MPEPLSPADATQGHWRNPVFLLVFVPGAGAWLAVFGWLTWRYFNPVSDWVGGQNALVQEVLGIVLLLVWAVILGLGAGAVGMVAERVAGIPPATGPGQTHGEHAKWERPN